MSFLAEISLQRLATGCSSRYEVLLMTGTDVRRSAMKEAG